MLPMIEIFQLKFVIFSDSQIFLLWLFSILLLCHPTIFQNSDLCIDALKCDLPRFFLSFFQNLLCIVLFCWIKQNCLDCRNSVHSF